MYHLDEGFDAAAALLRREYLQDTAPAGYHPLAATPPLDGTATAAPVAARGAWRDPGTTTSRDAPTPTAAKKRSHDGVAGPQGQGQGQGGGGGGGGGSGGGEGGGGSVGGGLDPTPPSKRAREAEKHPNMVVVLTTYYLPATYY